jgi:hypothetical protein
MKLRSTLLASSLAVAALAIAAQASANCSYPKAPDKLPDGSKASKEEMISGSQSMKAYNDLITQYQACLQTEHDAAVAKLKSDPSLSADKKSAEEKDLDTIQQQKNDAAADDAEAVIGRFNDQIKAYNAAHAK